MICNLSRALSGAELPIYWMSFFKVVDKVCYHKMELSILIIISRVFFLFHHGLWLKNASHKSELHISLYLDLIG